MTFLYNIAFWETNMEASNADRMDFNRDLCIQNIKSKLIRNNIRDVLDHLKEIPYCCNKVCKKGGLSQKFHPYKEANLVGFKTCDICYETKTATNYSKHRMVCYENLMFYGTLSERLRLNRIREHVRRELFSDWKEEEEPVLIQKDPKDLPESQDDWTMENVLFSEIEYATNKILEGGVL